MSRTNRHKQTITQSCATERCDCVVRSLDETMQVNEAVREAWLESGKAGPPEYYMEFEEVQYISVPFTKT